MLVAISVMLLDIMLDVGKRVIEMLDKPPYSTLLSGWRGKKEGGDKE